MARFVFMNGVPSDRRRFMAGKLYAESLRILTEKVSRRGIPDDIPRTWILTRRDRALSPKVQHKYIDALGGVQALIEMDTCHMMLVSEPEQLVKILVERCRLYASANSVEPKAVRPNVIRHSDVLLAVRGEEGRRVGHRLRRRPAGVHSRFHLTGESFIK